MSRFHPDFRIRAGTRDVAVRVPASHRVTYVPKREIPVIADAAAAIEAALESPLGSGRLEDLARGAKSAAVVIPDLTRPCPDRLLLPPLLARLARGGLGPSAVTLVIATGLHRDLTEEERRDHLGPFLDQGYRCLDHAPSDPDRLTTYGETSQGLPIHVNQVVASSDLVVSTGIVEPHQFAGFSGGYKTVVIGTGGEPTISASHSPRFLCRPGVGLGTATGNPFREFLEEAGRRIGHRFAINVVLDPSSHIAALAAGEPGAVVAKLVPEAMAAYLEPMPGDFDLAIAGVPHPKDQNLYQATRVPTYLQAGARPLIRPGGTLVVAAGCPEGAGRGTGEERFARFLAELGDPDTFVRTAERDGLEGGGQRAYFVARVLARNKIMFAGAQDPDLIKRMGMDSAPDVASALERVWGDGRSLDVLVVEDPFRTLPVRQ